MFRVDVHLDRSHKYQVYREGKGALLVALKEKEAKALLSSLSMFFPTREAKLEDQLVDANKELRKARAELEDQRRRIEEMTEQLAATDKLRRQATAMAALLRDYRAVLADVIKEKDDEKNLG